MQSALALAFSALISCFFLRAQTAIHFFHFCLFLTENKNDLYAARSNICETVSSPAHTIVVAILDGKLKLCTQNMRKTPLTSVSNTYYYIIRRMWLPLKQPSQMTPLTAI